MLKTIPLLFQNTSVDLLFYQYDAPLPPGGDPGFHEHVSFEIHFARQGACRYEFSDREIVLERGHMLIIPPRCRHRLSRIAGEKYAFIVLTLKLSPRGPDSACPWFDTVLRRHAQKSLPVQEKLPRAILRLERAVWQGTGDCLQDVYLTSRAADILYQLCAFLSEGEAVKGPDRAEQQHLDVQIENLVNHESLSLQDIAQCIHYSPRQTERLIKKLYGCSLSKVRQDILWKNAKRS